RKVPSATRPSALLGGAPPGRARLPFKKADAVGAQGAAQESPPPRSRVRIGQGRLPTAAHEPSGFGTGVLAALEDGGAGDPGRLVAFGSLYEALTAGGEVVDDLGRVQAQAVEIDQVDVGALPGLQPSAVVEAEEIGGLARLALHHVFEAQT